MICGHFLIFLIFYRVKIIYKNSLADSKAYYKLYESTGWNEKYHKKEEDFLQSLANSWYYLQAYDQDKLVGSGRIISDGILYGMIYDLIVYPDYRNQGIASEILKGLINRALAHNILNIQLFSADQKMSFYEKRGFVARAPTAAGMTLDLKKWRALNE